jgi:hypothetical protein
VSYQVGDLVRLTTMPAWVKTLPEESQLAFKTCYRRSYKIAHITRDGLLVLDVSRDVDPVLGTNHNDLRVEPDYVTPTRG